MGLLDQLWGNRNLQFLFEKLQSVSLLGMNYGRASDYGNNGEARMLEKVGSIVGTAKTILFDVGANQGEFTRHILEAWGGMSYRVYAFEPSKKTFEMLRMSIEVSPFVHLYNIGFGERPDHVQLYYDREGSGLASIYPRDLSHRNIEFTDHETIELTTLDIFCQQHEIDSIDYLKMDVEGHELAVLKGAKKLFEQQKIKIVQFEFGGCNIDSRTYFRDYYNFFKKDFKLFRILSNGLRPINSYSEKLEVFQSANYLAIRNDLAFFV